MSSPKNFSWLTGVERILCAKTHDLRKLAELAGLDPKTMYIGTRMDGADLRGQDLRGMKFTELDHRFVQVDHMTRFDNDLTPDADAQALVLLDDAAFEEEDWLRPLNFPFDIALYSRNESSTFWKACKNFTGPKIVVSWARYGHISNNTTQNKLDESGIILLVAVEARSGHLHEISQQWRDNLNTLTILAPVISFGSRTRRGGPVLPRTLLDLIWLVRTIWPDLILRTHFRGLLTFLAVQADRRSDLEGAWLDLASRAWRLGLPTNEGTSIFIFGSGSVKSYSSKFLFPEFKAIAIRKNESWPLFDAAILVEGPVQRLRLWALDYVRIVGRTLESKGWKTQNLRSRTAKQHFNFLATGRNISIKIETNVGTTPIFSRAFINSKTLAFNKADCIVVSENNDDAASVLMLLALEKKVRANLKDLRWLEADTTTLWPVVAQQARRIARAPHNWARCLYFAALLQSALEGKRSEVANLFPMLNLIRSEEFDQKHRLLIKTLDVFTGGVIFEISIMPILIDGPYNVERIILRVDSIGPTVEELTITRHAAAAAAV